MPFTKQQYEAAIEKMEATIDRLRDEAREAVSKLAGVTMARDVDIGLLEACTEKVEALVRAVRASEDIHARLKHAIDGALAARQENGTK